MLLHRTLSVILLSGLSYAAIAPGIKNNCPDEEDIYPCTCKPNYDTSCLVRCYAVGIDSLQNLTKVPNLCKGHVHLTLIHSTVKGIPTELWKILLSSKSVDVSFMYSNVQYLIPPGDEPMPSIQTPGEAYIKVQHSSSIEKWDWAQLKNFVAEDDLTIIVDDTPLPVLSKDFSQISGGAVEKVFIDRAQLSDVPDGVFQDFKALYSLSLQDNSLTEVRRSMFPIPATNLRFLHLNGNLFRSLPTDLFSDMPALEIVYLRENKLTSLPAEVFNSVNSDKLRLIDFIRNPWNCDCRLTWIVTTAGLNIEMGTCATPENLTGKEVKTVSKILNC